MDEKPGIVKFTPPSSSRSAVLIAVVGAVGVQVALCAVLIAIHFQDMWLSPARNGEPEMEFVPSPEEIVQEQEDVQIDDVVPVAAPPVITPVPTIPSNEILVMKSPENEDCSWVKDFLLEDTPSELVPEEVSNMWISMNKPKKKSPVKTPAVSLPSRPDSEQNISQNKEVRYKHAPDLPQSINSSKIGKVNAVIKVVVGVSPSGDPSSVDLLQSTGNAELDRLFMRWVRENWTFYPAEKDGVPIASKVVVPVRLNID